MIGKEDKYPFKHTDRLDRASGVDAKTVLIRFSQEVISCFAELEQTVRNSEHFDKDILENLRSFGSGSSVDVQLALTEMLCFARETMKHVHATGDLKAEEALRKLTLSLMGNQYDSKPVAMAKTGMGEFVVMPRAETKLL